MPDESRRATTRLDPRAPLVLDTRELGRRPGSMRTLSRSCPAPADLGVDVLGVPEGSPLELDLRLESVVEGVLVSGTASGHACGECVRCLDPVTGPLEVDLQELYVYPRPARATTGGSPTRTTTGACRSSRATCSTSSRCCGTRWCSHCRSSRCAGTTARAVPRVRGRLADDPEHAHDAVDPTPGWAAAPCTRPLSRPTTNDSRVRRPSTTDDAPPTKRRTSRGRPEAEDVAQQHPLAPGPVEGRPPLPWRPCNRCREPKLAAPGVPELRHLQRPRTSSTSEVD